jgi:hypothetical protein
MGLMTCVLVVRARQGAVESFAGKDAEIAVVPEEVQ